MHPILNIAVKAARSAASIINRASRDLEAIQIERKAPHDYVTEVDRMAEAAIIETLTRAYPDFGILAEESGTRAGANPDSPYQWLIDPLDGTTNFLHGLPQYAVSIALAKEGVVEQAVVYDVNRNELFCATKGAGAFLNDRRLRVSKRLRLSESLIGTGFPFKEFRHIDRYLAQFRALSQECAGIRRPGSAALDLAWLAAGRLDGFWEYGLSPWDVAAGGLLITEAGGLIADLEGGEDWLETGNLIAGTPKIFEQLRKIVALN
ncbi:MAG: inositol monophosphatase [Zoogloeaceae bacterium]|jgi:myo-inositol-1(or 4)-monophosphatase|nr:inositol monophosphatase [Zoogloeaceae bacterium]